MFVTVGSYRYPSVPLGFFFLSTLAVLAVQDRLPETEGRLSVLAGLLAGAAAWTKNEGTLFVAVLVLARLLVLLPGGAGAAPAG